MIKEERGLSPYFQNFETLPLKVKRKSVQIKSITGNRVQLVYIQLDPDFTSNQHHENEQLGIVQSGSIELTINGTTKICGKGDAYYIPADVPHSFQVRSESPAEVLEVFSPPKPENKM